MSVLRIRVHMLITEIFLIAYCFIYIYISCLKHFFLLLLYIIFIIVVVVDIIIIIIVIIIKVQRFKVYLLPSSG